MIIKMCIRDRVSAYGTLQFFNTLAKLLEIPVAALAELKKPAKVIAT